MKRLTLFNLVIFFLLPLSVYAQDNIIVMKKTDITSNFISMCERFDETKEKRALIKSAHLLHDTNNKMINDYIIVNISKGDTYKTIVISLANYREDRDDYWETLINRDEAKYTPINRSKIAVAKTITTVTRSKEIFGVLNKELDDNANYIKILEKNSATKKYPKVFERYSLHKYNKIFIDSNDFSVSMNVNIEKNILLSQGDIYQGRKLKNLYPVYAVGSNGIKIDSLDGLYSTNPGIDTLFFEGGDSPVEGNILPFNETSKLTFIETDAIIYTNPKFKTIEVASFGLEKIPSTNNVFYATDTLEVKMSGPLPKPGDGELYIDFDNHTELLIGIPTALLMLIFLL